MLSDVELEQLFVAHVQTLGLDLKVEDLRAWRQALETCPAGYLCLESWWDEYQLELNPKLDILAYAVLFYLGQQAAAAGKQGREPKPFEALARACMRFPDLGDDIRGPLHELARFMDLQAAQEHIFPRRGRAGIYASSDSRLWEDVLAGPDLVRGDVPSRLEGRIRGGWDVNIFSTLASWMERAPRGASGPRLAEWVRDTLGLPHLAGKVVLEIRIPEEAVWKRQVVKKPTFADSGGYPPFMPSQPGEPHGWARDIGQGKIAARGGPEIWHAPLPAREASGLRVLGRAPAELKVKLWQDYVSYSRRHGTP